VTAAVRPVVDMPVDAWFAQHGASPTRQVSYRLLWEPEHPQLAQLVTGRHPASGMPIAHVFCHRLLVDGTVRRVERGGMTVEPAEDADWLTLSMPGWAVHLRVVECGWFDWLVFCAQVEGADGALIGDQLLGRCPGCRQPVRSLLAGCRTPACVAAEIAADAALDLRIEACDE
jgi:hypothetical protein